MAKRWVIKLGCGLLTRKDGKVDRVHKAEGSKPLLRYRGNYSSVGNTI